MVWSHDRQPLPSLKQVKANRDKSMDKVEIKHITHTHTHTHYPLAPCSRRTVTTSLSVKKAERPEQGSNPRLAVWQAVTLNTEPRQRCLCICVCMCIFDILYFVTVVLSP